MLWKVKCRNENDQKLCMILAACNMQVLKVSEICSSGDDDDILNCSSNSSVASDMVDNIDFANALPVTVNSATVFVVALWLKLALSTQESEIIEKWFAGICTVRKKVLLYICWAQVNRRFLIDSDSEPTYTELICLKLHQPGCTGYIESIPYY